MIRFFFFFFFYFSYYIFRQLFVHTKKTIKNPVEMTTRRLLLFPLLFCSTISSISYQQNWKELEGDGVGVRGGKGGGGKADCSIS